MASTLESIRGPARLLGDDVNTDTNCSGKYLPGKDEAWIAAQVFEPIVPGFAARFSPGDIIVAGTHFGINSSREQAVHILRRIGVSAIVAKSFGRQFFRNAINNGLVVVECDTSDIGDGDRLALDFDADTLQIQSRASGQSRKHLAIAAVPPTIRAILREGGLIPFLRKYPDWKLDI